MEQTVFDPKILEKRIIETLLTRAKVLQAKAQYAEAETLTKEALTRAEVSTGSTSLVTGLVLMDLLDLYDKLGRETEATALWERIRNILLLATFLKARQH
ncbi:MAG: tetratricopeptide repeat protein [Cyanobacteria bacterium SZAS LIN-5]|nr:tetratricopeptide repeat protein [Cyanobacteria bacterium SZAS LIN-5]